MTQTTAALTWTNETRQLGDLQPWEHNPRFIDEDGARHLRDSFNRFGQVEPLLIGPNNEVYNGHQRLTVLMEEHGPDYVVEVRVASRELTERERAQLTAYLHRGATGEWDFEMLARFDDNDLLAWGFEEWELVNGDGWSDPPELEELEEEYGAPQEEDWWPHIRVRVSPDTYERWADLLRAATGEEHERVAKILEAVNEDLLG